MRDFVFNGQPSRVVFGPGSLAHLERELELLGAARVLVLSTPGQAAAASGIAQRLGGRVAGVCSTAVEHVPAAIAAHAAAEARRLAADCTLAYGGGSTVGLAKAIALETSLPILAVPTTYAGSEMTPIYGLTDGGLKKTGRDARVLPRTVLYDPELTVRVPLEVSVPSAMNAIAHAAEALYAQDANPVTDLMAQEGIAALARALPELRGEPAALPARSEALYGAWLCGSVLGAVGMALHHKLCHTLGGSFGLPHAQVHAVVLPQALAFNAAAAPQAMERIARALGRSGAASGVYDLARECGAPLALKDLGMAPQDLDRAAELAVRNPYWNPRPIGPAQRSEIRELLQRAYDGIRPD